MRCCPGGRHLKPGTSWQPGAHPLHPPPKDCIPSPQGSLPSTFPLPSGKSLGRRTSTGGGGGGSGGIASEAIKIRNREAQRKHREKQKVGIVLTWERTFKRASERLMTVFAGSGFQESLPYVLAIAFLRASMCFNLFAVAQRYLRFTVPHAGDHPRDADSAR